MLWGWGFVPDPRGCPSQDRTEKPGAGREAPLRVARVGLHPTVRPGV